MVFVRGWGGIVGLVIAAAVGAVLEGGGASRAVAYCIGGLAMGAFGLWLRTHEGAVHSVFFLPVDVIGGLIAVGALAGA